MEVDWDMVMCMAEPSMPTKVTPPKVTSGPKAIKTECAKAAVACTALADVVKLKRHEFAQHLPLVPKDINVNSLPAHGKAWVGKTWVECIAGRLGCIACKEAAKDSRIGG